MDLDALLQSHGDEAPSGEDLEYDSEFTAMVIAAQPGEERQVNDEIVPGDDPDYRDVADKALAILQRTHDLRAAILLAEAQLRLKGLPAFAECTAYVRRCLEEHWATCHPQLDAEDDNDPTMRVNAVLAMADPARIVRGVRLAPLTASRMFGAFSLRDLQVANGEVAPSAADDEIPDRAAIAAAFEDTDDETLAQTRRAAEAALADVRAIGAKFDEETPGRGPVLEALEKVLQNVVRHLGQGMGEDAQPAEDGAEAGVEAPAAGAPRASGGAPGAITSPTDVTAALDRVIQYYQRNEPSSPVPILLERAKKLVNADFLTIMKDMAPLGVDNVKLIGGIEEDQGY